MIQSRTVVSILIFIVTVSLALSCGSKPKSVSEQLIGKWQLMDGSFNEKDVPADTKTVTFTFAEDKSCTYDFLTNGVSEKKEVCYYLLLNDETVIATYYDNLFVEIQEQFDIVKLEENKLKLKERKINGKPLELVRMK